MSDGLMGLIGSCVVALFTYLGVVYQSKKNNDSILAKLEKQSELSDAKLDAKLERYQAVTDTKIEELTREVRAHNGHQERISLLEAEDKRLNERIKILEGKPA